MPLSLFSASSAPAEKLPAQGANNRNAMNRLIFKVEMRGLGPHAPDAWAWASRARCVGLGLTRPPFEKKRLLGFPLHACLPPLKAVRLVRFPFFHVLDPGITPDTFQINIPTGRHANVALPLGCMSGIVLRQNTQRGARTHDHEVKGLALCRLS
jgi:hypothetical protein